MDILEAIKTERLTLLYNEVKELKPKEEIELELIEDPTGEYKGLSEVIYGNGTQHPVIRVEKRDIDNENPELEMFLAHELLHIKRRRIGFPELIKMPLSVDDIGFFAAESIEDLVDHSMVYAEMRQRGFNLDSYISGRLSGLMDAADSDVPLEQMGTAYNLADFILSFSPDEIVVNQLKSHLPKIYLVADKLVTAVKSYDLNTANDTRRCFMRLINFTDDYLKVTPPLVNQIGIDLVLTKEQLLGKMTNIGYRQVNMGSGKLLQILYQHNQFSPGFFFAVFDMVENPQVLAQLNYYLKSSTLKEFLDVNDIKYFVR